jgi:alpha 1,3-glucosidase
MWYTLAAEWSMRGLPILRPLWYHDLADLQAYNHVEDHFCVGEALIVRSIPDDGSKALDVYLPPGKWFDYWDKTAKSREGGQAFTVKTHPAHVPVFVKQGSILTKKQRPRRSTQAMTNDPYTVIVYGAPARGRVYVDDGRTHDFQSGSFIYDEIEFDGAVLRSRPVDLALPGLKVSPEGRRAPSEPAEAGLRVEQVVIVGLPSPPKKAEVVKRSDHLEEVEVSAAQASGGSTWVATVRNPSVQLGPPNSWAIRLVF